MKISQEWYTQTYDIYNNVLECPSSSVECLFEMVLTANDMFNGHRTVKDRARVNRFILVSCAKSSYPRVRCMSGTNSMIERKRNSAFASENDKNTHYGHSIPIKD